MRALFDGGAARPHVRSCGDSRGATPYHFELIFPGPGHWHDKLARISICRELAGFHMSDSE
jgi:hypothetical protein